MAHVAHYDALQDADKIKVNAAIRYSMSQDVGFCKAFLKSVKDAETKLDKESILPLSHRDEAYQQTIDALRSRLSQHLEDLPAVKTNGSDAQTLAFDLAAQRAEFRGTRHIENAESLIKAVTSTELKTVELNGRTFSVEGKGYSTPRLTLDDGAQNAPESVSFKQHMRQEMTLTGTQILFNAAGVTLAEGSHAAAVPAQKGGRALS